MQVLVQVRERSRNTVQVRVKHNLKVILGAVQVQVESPLSMQSKKSILPCPWGLHLSMSPW